MDTAAHLESLGLSDKEARCYVALVELGQATAYQVATHAKLKKPITYVILDELRRKGLALKVPHAKKQLFIAKQPDELFAAYEEKLLVAKRALPELLASAQRKGRDVRALYFDDAGMRDALSYKLEDIAGKEMLVLYGKGKGPVPQMYFDRNKTLHDQGTRIRGFAPTHSSLDEFRKLDKKYGWNITTLPKTEFSSEASIEAADSFVRVILHKSRQAVIIDNKEFASMMREVIEMLWKSKKF